MKNGVLIGRFQPFHLGHAHLLSTALSENDHVYVVVGSSNRHASVKNPFTFTERKEMIIDWIVHESDYNVSQVSFVSSPDNLYKEWSWKSEIIRGINDLLPSGLNKNDLKFSLYGHSKDASSYYLTEFPEWKFKEVPCYHGIDATGIRSSFFEDGIISSYDSVCESTRNFMRNYKTTSKYQDLLEEWEFFKNEKVLFSDYPFPTTLNFTCSDAVVVCQGHLLLIKRKNAPGKNAWALPGGFKENTETFLDACIRELKEETNLRIPEKVLRGSIKNVQMFDDVRRNIGIARVSMAYHIEVLPNADNSFPEIRPDSDAYSAQWVELSEALSMNIFDDHLDIIRWFI